MPQSHLALQHTLYATPPSHGAVPAANTFRADIDGLRAIAILLVVAFHAHIPGFSGGFIGVDIFFVISGFLITRNLLTEIEQTGRIRLLNFWAKRIRRLVPALSAMVLVTIALALVVQSPIEWHTMLKQGASALLYSSNAYLAFTMGYFDEDVTKSPFLHTWSLSLEEQFYVFWPLLLLGVCVFARNRRWNFRSVLLVVLGGGAVISCALGAWLTYTTFGAPHAFYSLPTRAWEFAVAGILAAIPLPKAFQQASVRYLCMGAGAAMLMIAMANVSDQGGYPGAWALLPVGGTLLLIAGNARGDEAFWPKRLLSSSPMQWIGRVSYSWYLWHWPFIALLVVALGKDEVGLRIAAAFAALPVAAFMYHFFENPVRFSPHLTRSLKRTYLFGVATTAVGLIVAGIAFRYATGKISESPYHELAEIKKARMQWCPVNQTTSSGISYCLRGSETGTKAVVLIGDSHALQWVPAFGQVAQEFGIRLIVRERSLCPAIPVHTTVYGIRNIPCAQYQAETDQLIRELHPDAVIISQFRGYIGRILTDDNIVPDTAQQVTLWAQAFQEYLTSIHDRKIALGVVVDNPRFPQDPILCIARHGSSDQCTFVVESDRNLLLQEAERNVLRKFTHVPVFAVTDALCPHGVCAIQREAMYTMFDTDHLTEAFTMTQKQQIGALFQDLLGVKGKRL